jgi:competence protein ComGC
MINTESRVRMKNKKGFTLIELLAVIEMPKSAFSS